jgi:hypothetical protein
MNRIKRLICLVVGHKWYQPMPFACKRCGYWWWEVRR